MCRPACHFGSKLNAGHVFAGNFRRPGCITPRARLLQRHGVAVALVVTDLDVSEFCSLLGVEEKPRCYTCGFQHWSMHGSTVLRFAFQVLTRSKGAPQWMTSGRQGLGVNPALRGRGGRGNFSLCTMPVAKGGGRPFRTRVGGEGADKNIGAGESLSWLVPLHVSRQTTA